MSRAENQRKSQIPLFRSQRRGFGSFLKQNSDWAIWTSRFGFPHESWNRPKALGCVAYADESGRVQAFHGTALSAASRNLQILKNRQRMISIQPWIRS